jgi:hypothetical protein
MWKTFAVLVTILYYYYILGSKTHVILVQLTNIQVTGLRLLHLIGWVAYIGQSNELSKKHVDKKKEN